MCSDFVTFIIKSLQINSQKKRQLMLSSQKSHGLLSEDLIIQHNQTVHLQSHPICKQLKATDLFCILGHKQLESRQ